MESKFQSVSIEGKAIVRDALKATLDEIAALEKIQTSVARSKKVIILITKAGGGHFAVAKSIYDFLEKTDYKPSFVIIDELKNADPFFQISGKFSSSLYNEIHQQQGDLVRFGKYMSFISLILPYYVINSENRVIKGRIDSLNPIAVINTLPFTDVYVSPSFSSQIPQLLLSTDFDIWGFLR